MAVPGPPDNPLASQPRTLTRRTVIFGGIVLCCLLGIALFGSMNRSLIGGVAMHLHDVLSMPIFVLGKVPITLIFLVKVILFLMVLVAIANGSLHLLQRRLLTHTPLRQEQQFAVARLISYGVFALGLVIGLESFGLNLSSLVVVGGALGLGVGLGLQTVVANFVAGLILLFEQPIRIGDRIAVGDTGGDVIDIRGRSTWVRTNDNIVIIIPNSDLITKQITNWTLNDREVRIAVPLGVGYASDPAQVRDILLSVARENSDVLDDPAPTVIFQDFGASTLDFVLRVWTITQVQNPMVLRSELYFEIFKRFAEAGIELPFAQHDLHVRSIAPAAVEALRTINRKEPSGT
jgi:small-conductance mechanosensitive channel